MKALFTALALTIGCATAYAAMSPPTAEDLRSRMATPDDVIGLMGLAATQQLPGHEELQNCLNELSSLPGKTTYIKVIPGVGEEPDTKYTVEKFSSGGSSYMNITAGEGSISCNIVKTGR